MCTEQSSYLLILVDQSSDLWDLLRLSGPARGEGCKECRQRALKSLLYEAFALPGIEFLSGKKGCYSALPVLENAFVTQTLQDGVGSGLLP